MGRLNLRLTRHHRPREPHLNTLKRPKSLKNMLPTDPERRQSMQNRLLEPSHRRELGIDMQRIPVSHQAIQRRKIRTGLLLDDLIGRTVRRIVRCRRSPAIRRLLRAAEAATTADEGDAFVVEDFLPRSVSRGVTTADKGGVALVDDFDKVSCAVQGAGGRDGPLLNFEVLFAVQQHALIVVGNDVFEVVGGGGVVGGHDAEGGEDHEVVCAFENERQICPLGSDAEVVEDDVSVGVGICRWSTLEF